MVGKISNSQIQELIDLFLKNGILIARFENHKKFIEYLFDFL